MSAVGQLAPLTTFALPDELSATEPPEERGLDRSAVRLLVAGRDGVTHTRFHFLADHLLPGDLVVVNTSATSPAALSGTRAGGRDVAVHVSSPLADTTYVVELRCADGSCRITDAHVGETIALSGGGSVTLRSGHPNGEVRVGSRLWRATFTLATSMDELLARHGRPISYGYVPRRWPLEAYQPVFARPGHDWTGGGGMASAEMASAGRPFTDRMVTELVTRGVLVAPITLHTGVSSLETGEPPLPERYAVPATTARLVNATRRAGGRVVAVGTTVTRALESVADLNGWVRSDSGWTDVVLGPPRPARVVTGLVTGWHEPQASHLLLLEAVAGPALVQRAYAAALAEGYLWHEFGDSALLLP